MRKLVSLLVVMVLSLAAFSGVVAQDSQDAVPVAGSAEPAHLIVTVASGGEARVNRMDWDVNAFAPVYPGTGVRASDYIDISGRTTLQILCADLSLLEQRGSEVPRCDPYPADPAFFYASDPAWTMPDGVRTVVTYPANLATIPAEVVNPGGYNLNELVGGQLDVVIAQRDAIQSLGMSANAQAYALGSLYRGEGMIFQALAELVAMEGLECIARRPSVTPPSGDTYTLVQSPVVYLRIGELYELLGQREDALRNYRCAADLAQTVGDTAGTALAFARWGNLEPDPAAAIQYYQESINNYAALGAADAEIMLEICGSRNCAMP